MADKRIAASVGSITTGNPGDRFLLDAGQRGRLSLVGLRGTEAAPIIIEGDDTHIAGGSVGMYIDNCKYVVVKSVEFSGFSNSGITARRGTDFLELSNLHFHNGMTGIRISNLAADVPGGFVAQRFWIHHCLFQDIEKEAGYLGHGLDQTNKGTPIEEMLIENCVAERCGWDAIQVREVRRKAIVRNCRCVDIGGLVGGTSQGGAGIILGHDTKGEVYDNVIINADRGVQGLDHLAGCKIHHNLIVHCGYVRDQDGILMFTSAPVDIYNNTIVQSKDNGIRARDGNVYNNLVVASGGEQIKADTGTNIHHNVLVSTLADAKFVDPSNEDYRLQAGSPAIGKADDGGTCGAFSFGEAPPPPPPTPSEPEPPTPSTEPPEVVFPGEFRVTMTYADEQSQQVVVYAGTVKKVEQ